LLVDHADRLHFIGSDMVMSQDVSFSAEGGRAERWRFTPAAWNRLFPPERFPRGFAAPECFLAAGRPNRRSDLYAWGALAFFLLSGQMPWQIALDQGRPWAQFQEPLFKLLEKTLRDVPATHVANWVEQLGLAGQ